MSNLAIQDASVQPIDFELADDAIYDWATNVLDGINAIWENQNIPQPHFPYLSLLRQGEVDDGGVDEQRYQTIATDGSVMLPGSTKTPDHNVEILYQPVTFVVTIQAHVDFAAGATDPNSNATKLLSKLKRSLGFTSVRQNLKRSGLGFVRSDSIPDNGVVVNGEWLSRAALDVTFRTASVMSEPINFFDKVRVKSTSLDFDFTVDAS